MVMSRCRRVDRDYVRPLKQVSGANSKHRKGRDEMSTVRLEGIKEGGGKNEDHFPRKKVRMMKKKKKKKRRKGGKKGGEGGGVLPVIRAKRAIIA